MKKLANTLSPALQNAQMDMAQQEQSVDKEDIFKQLFTEQAYKSFNSKFSYLTSYIVNFKILNTDVDKGYAIGSFFLDIPGAKDFFIVPIILKSNSIQPMLFIYDKSMDTFLPLNRDWIDEILKKIPELAGKVSKPDMTSLNMNNNISQISSLPRYNGLTNFIGKLASVNIYLPDVIKSASEEGKEKFLKFLHENKKIAEHLLTSYEIEAIKNAFAKEEKQEKKADTTAVTDKDIFVVTPRIPLDVVKKEFARDQVVMEDVAFRGYHIKDKRDVVNKMVVFTDHLNALENPTKSGPYEVYLSSGKVVPVLVIQDPIMLDVMKQAKRDSSDFPVDSYKSYQIIAKNMALVLFSDGKFSVVKNDNVMASPTLSEALNDTDIHKYVYGDKTKEVPLNKPFIFIKKTGNGYITTGPITVRTKTTTKDGEVICSTEFGNTTIKYTDKYKGSNIYVTKDNVVFVPNSFKVIPLKEEVPPRVIMGSMKSILSMISNRLIEKGGTPVTIVKDGKGDYGVETNRPIIKSDAIVKIAKDYDVNAKEVESLMDAMEKDGIKVASFFVIPKKETIGTFINKEEKVAFNTMPQNAGLAIPTGTMPMDESLVQPGMMGAPQMDPQMMAQMAAQMNPQMNPQMDPQMMAQMAAQMNPQMMGMMPQMNPQDVMSAGMGLSQATGDPSMFDASALMSLSYMSELDNIFPKYIPNLITALDNVSRILITFWINAEEIQEEIGISEYSEMEQKLKTLFSAMNDFLLSLNKKIDIFDYAKVEK